MKNASEIIACVIDHGQFISVARKLGEQMAKVYYWSPAERSLPMIQEGIIGDGFDEIERVNDFWKVKDECDLFVFPDVGFGGLQRELISQGKPVWGARDASRLETNRGAFLSALKRCGLDVPPHQTVKGWTALRDFLMDEEDKYIKISQWRGNFETFHWTNWKESESELDLWAIDFGAVKEQVMFYVFDPIDTDVEDGIDSYCIDSTYPGMVLHGMEHKDKSFIGCMTSWEDLPEQVRSVNESFSPALSDYRGFFSTEVRIKDGQSYFIDATCRAGSPPHQVQTELWSNYADIIWQGANGVCIDPEPTALFGVQALLSYTRTEKEWKTFQIPDSIAGHVKCGFCCRINDRLCFPPHPLETMAGYLTATGKTMGAAIKSLKSYSKELPCGLHCDITSLAELLVNISDAEDEGIEIGDKPIPEPAIVVED